VCVRESRDLPGVLGVDVLCFGRFAAAIVDMAGACGLCVRTVCGKVRLCIHPRTYDVTLCLSVCLSLLSMWEKDIFLMFIFGFVGFSYSTACW
jgi:hypothetical protein